MKGREILAANLTRLMEIHGLKTQNDVARFARVSQTMVGNILRMQQGPTVDFMQELANGFKIPLWVLLGPAEFLDSGERLETLVSAFVRSSQEGQKTILRVADVEAQSERQSHPPEGFEADSKHSPTAG